MKILSSLFKKVEYPPLLPLGLHLKTVPEVRQMCCVNFPLSKTRDRITTGLEYVIDALKSDAIVGDVWVDGSYMTEKINPNDSDILLSVQGHFYNNIATPTQRQIIDWVGNADLKTPHYCDSYVAYQYPASHPLYWLSEYLQAYWIKQFGFSRTEDMKGMALIRLP